MVEAKKAEVEALRKVLSRARETGSPKEAYAKDMEGLYRAEAELQKAQSKVLAPSAKLYKHWLILHPLALSSLVPTATPEGR